MLFRSEMFSANVDIDPKKTVGQKVTFSVMRSDQSFRHFHGHVSRFAAGDEKDGRRSYRAEVVPWLWFLTRTSDCRIFQNKTLPEIIKQVFDDLGFNDLTFSGGGVADGSVPTRAIDSIAEQGVRFTSGYSGNATCAPSRAAILTGRYPTRFGFEFTPAPKVFMRLVARRMREQSGLLHQATYHREREKEVPSMEAQGVPPSEITLAELLRTRGYHTIGLGKWHLGETPALRPEAQGEFEIFGAGAGLVRSDALVRLKVNGEAPVGVIAFGSRQIGRAHV